MGRDSFLKLIDRFFGGESPIREPIETLKDGAALRVTAPGRSIVLEKIDGIFTPVDKDDVKPHLEMAFADLDALRELLMLGDPVTVGDRMMEIANDGGIRIRTLRPFVELLEKGLGFFLEAIGVLRPPLGYPELISPLRLREIAFTEILDVKYLQGLVDELALMTGVRLWILDLNAMPIVVSTTAGEHCKLLIDSLRGVTRCYDSAMGALAELKKAMTPKVRICHAGFVCFDAPLILANEMVGMISGDASLTETPDREAYRKLAEELEIDPEPLLESLNHVRYVKIEEVGFLLSVVNVISRVVTEMSFKQYMFSDLSQELRRKNIELKALFQAMTGIQEKEKAAVARDLHDDTGQNLTNALVNLEMALSENGCTDAVNKQIKSASDSISAVLKQLHDLSASLHPPIIDDLGLTEALRNLLRRMNADHAIDFKLITGGEEGNLPYEVKINLYRIAQEALSNIIRHSGAKQAIVYFHILDDAVDLLIMDDGMGFPEATPADDLVHLGLVNMRERSEQIGGTFECPPTNRGVAIVVRVPLNGRVRG